MEPQAPGNLPTTNPQDLSFQVMPQAGQHYEAPKETPVPKSAGPLPPPPPPVRGIPSAPVPKVLSHLDAEPPFFRSGKFYLIIAIAVAIILAIGGWLLYGPKKSSTPEETPQSATKLPKVWLKQYFDKEVCDDQSICGDNADPDSDGLQNHDEFVEGSSPINPDSDADGLADGDEVHIFKTAATLKFTDRRDVVAQNNWTDGFQVKNGYDPVTPGLKFTDARNLQIKADQDRLGLHEPSKTTLGVPPATTNDLPANP